MIVLAPVASAITATMIAVVARWRAKYRSAKRTSPISVAPQRETGVMFAIISKSSMGYRVALLDLPQRAFGAAGVRHESRDGAIRIDEERQRHRLISSLSKGGPRLVHQVPLWRPESR